MKNFRKPLLTLGIGACLLGGALTTLGSVSGGLNSLIQASNKDLKVTKVEESYEDVQSLNLNLGVRNLVIKESPDDQAHLTYYQSENHQIDGHAVGKITAQFENKSLDIQEEKEVNFSLINTGIRSLLSIFDQESNERRTVTLQLPKGSQLQDFTGNIGLGNANISDLVIEKSDFSLSLGNLEASNIQIASGSLSNSQGNITINNSQLTNLTLENSLGNIQVKQSKISDSDINLSQGNIESEQLELAGTISITDSLGDVHLQLVPGSLSALNFNLKTDLGEINLPDNIQANRSFGEDSDNGSVTHTADQPVASLTIHDSMGSIKLSE